jgi:hypothetical protein
VYQQLADGTPKKCSRTRTSFLPDDLCVLDKCVSVAGRWFSLDTFVSSTNKTDRYNIS